MMRPMSLGDRILSELVGLIFVGMIGLALRHAQKTGELLGKGRPIYRDEHPRLFLIGFRVYAVFGAVLLILVAAFAAGYGPW
jgi:hypothetical protein